MWPFRRRKAQWDGLDFNVFGLVQDDVSIAWGEVEKVTAGLFDAFTYDLIGITIESGGRAATFWEDWPRFNEFEDALRSRIPLDPEPLGFLRTHPFHSESFVLYERTALQADL